VSYGNYCRSSLYQGQFAFRPTATVPSGAYAWRPAIEDMSIGATSSASTGGVRISLSVAVSPFSTFGRAWPGGVVEAIMPTGFTSVPTWSWLALPSDILHDTTASDGDGRVEVFGLDPYDHVWHVWQHSHVDTEWSPTASLGGAMDSLQSYAWSDDDGHLELFGTDANHDAITHDFEVLNANGSVNHWVYE
jgi:hypothetical protein